MFDWIGDAIDWIGDGISSLWDNTIGNVTDAIGDWIWEAMFEWLFNLIYGAIDSNKIYVKERLQTEQNEGVRKLLQADYSFLDEIQAEMSSARQFMFSIRFRREKDEQIFNVVNRVDKAISEHGFAARRMTKSEIKRMLALYFGTSISGEEISDIEGSENFDLGVSEDV